MRVSQRRQILAATVVAVLVVGILGAVGVREYRDRAGPGGEFLNWSGAGATGPPPPARTGPVTTTGRGPAPPRSGTWFGAYVQSDGQTREAKERATTAFERQVKSPMSIVHTFHPWDDEFPSAYERGVVEDGKLLMLSWAGTDTRSLALGRYDDLIRTRAEAVRDLKVPLLLRFRWEMDRPNLQASVHSPADYIKAWKHVRRIFTEVGATNAGWVWCPLAPGFATGRAQPYYPGDDQVDWICADVYPGKEFRSFAELMSPVMSWARHRPRPVMVGEFGVRERDSGQRAAWLRGMQAFVDSQPQIKALVYFLAKKETKPVYDFTLGGEAEALRVFRSIVGSPPFETRAPTPPR